MASSGRAIVLGALLAGLAVGFRTQTFWITVPLLLLVLADRIGRGVAGAMLGSGIAFAAGVLAWAVPLVVASGGPQAYLAALGSQAGEDFAGVEMLYLNPAPRLAAFALLRTFVWPWDSVLLAAVVLMLAAAGLFLLLAGERRTLAAVAAITAPYLVFHLAFQDTTFARYALPLVWPVAFLAAVALDAAGRVGALAAVGLAAWSLSIAVPQLSAYVERGSPTARLFDRVTEAAATASPSPGRGDAPGTVASARGRAAAGGGAPAGAAPARVARTGAALAVGRGRSRLVPGRRAADRSGPDRLVRRGARPSVSSGDSRACRCWEACVPPTCSGTASPSPDGSPPRAGASRPKPRAWPASWGRGRTSPPSTPTCAGGRRPAACWSVVAISAPKGSAAGHLHPRHRREGARLVAAAARVFRALGDACRPAASPGPGRFADLTLASASPPDAAPVPTAIEQFDLQSPGITMWAFGHGFHEPELDNQRGRAWRWMSDEARLEIPQTAGDVTLVLEGESPLTYFDAPSTLEVWSGEAKLGHRAAVGGLRRPARDPRRAPRGQPGHAAPHHHADFRAGRAGRLRRPTPARVATLRRQRRARRCRPGETAQIHA